jgi:hypothetical protein
MKNTRFVLVTTVKSSAGDRRYKIKRDKTTGTLSCDCPAWIFQRGVRKPCKHIKSFLGDW